jgi:hypothetical protein
VFAVRSGGVTGVIVKGPTEQSTTSFRMEDKGPVISIKFSPDQQVLAIQRTKTSVVCLNKYLKNYTFYECIFCYKQ